MTIKRLALLITILLSAAPAFAVDQVRTANGVVEGRGVQRSGVRIFRGIPFAQPPIGELRWREPQPTQNWKGVRQAVDFGPRCLQAPIFADMRFRSNGMSEDCLYLNVWTPAKSNRQRLPVLVYFYGGGFVAGDSSELRYDGESMAAKGIVVVTVNYRLGVFGFMAHPLLTRESSYRASGNYGLLDQNAALRWVQKNITSFGGDPKRVTIGGESAGSVSVSAQMASPMSRDLIAGAIGESGAITGTLSAVVLAKGEEAGSNFTASLGLQSLAALRAVPAQELLDQASKGGWASVGRFPIVNDGYFFPENLSYLYGQGQQAHVPLLAGWNSEEGGWQALLGREEPTPENYRKVLEKLYGARADEALKLYPGATREEVIQSATDMAGDRFIAYSTWMWMRYHTHGTGSQVYRYLYGRARPAARGQNAPAARGAVHSAEIEYALGNLALMSDVYPWTEDDHRVSATMQNYFANFIKKGDPNGPGLPKWPAIQGVRGPILVMRLDVQSRVEPATTEARYSFLAPFLRSFP